MPKKPDPYLVDEDNPEATAEDFRLMRLASEVLPGKLYGSLVAKFNARHGGKGDVAVKEPGLDSRRHAKDGRTQRKRGDTLNKNLSPLSGFAPSTTLGGKRKKTGANSEAALRRATPKTTK